MTMDNRSTDERKAYLDLHVVGPDIVWSDFYDPGDADGGMGDDFRREIERKVASAVAGMLYASSTAVMVEAEWFFYDRPCPELVGYPEQEPCGEATTERRYGGTLSPELVCGVGHQTALPRITARDLSNTKERSR